MQRFQPMPFGRTLVKALLTEQSVNRTLCSRQSTTQRNTVIDGKLIVLNFLCRSQGDKQ